MTDDDKRYKTTRNGYLGTRFLNTPFWAMLNMIPFILFKDLAATPLQVTLVVMLKPAVSLIAFYWISTVMQRQDRLRRHITVSHVLGLLPFFFIPWVENPWYMVCAFGFYMTMYRGAIPSWMELLKLNVRGSARSRLFAFGNACCYVGDALWPLAFGWLLDDYNQSWRWIFPAAALVSLLALPLQRRIRFVAGRQSDGTEGGASLVQPWRVMWRQLQARPDFTRYQIGFMLGGAGLMIIQPVLPRFFMETLTLSYTEVGAAIVFCKAVGMAVASPFWARLIHRIDVYRFASHVTLLATLFPLTLILAKSHLGWLYGGYIAYGMMQAGSELLWNLSGPIFSKEEDSSVYTGINVVMQGLRGLFVPAIGGLLAVSLGLQQLLLIGALLCGLAAFQLHRFSRQSAAVGEFVSLET